MSKQQTEEQIISKLPEPDLTLTNKSALPDNYLYLDGSGRFLFQCTYETLFVYDLIWKIRRRIELPESRCWLLFVMLISNERILIAYKENCEKSRILLNECQLNYEKMCISIVRKHSFQTSELPPDYPSFHAGPCDWVQQLSTDYVCIANFCDGSRNIWIVNAAEPSKRQLVLLPPEIRFFRFAILINRHLCFFANSLNKIWHLRRIYSMNIDSGTVSELPLSALMNNEDQISNIQVTDGAWNYALERLSLTFQTRKNNKTEKHLLILDLATRTWKHLDVSTNCSDTSILDVKHRVDQTNGSILLILNQALKFTNKTLVYRLSVREPARLSELAFNAVLRANPQFSRLKANQLQSLGISIKHYPLFKPTDHFWIVRLLLFWCTCIFSLVGIFYYFMQIILLSYSSLTIEGENLYSQTSI